MKRKVKSIVKILVLVAATFAVVEYGRGQLELLNISFTEDVKPTDVKPADNQQWFFTTSDTYITKQSLDQSAPKSEEKQNRIDEGKPVEHTKQSDNSPDINEYEVPSQHTSELTQTLRQVTSGHKIRKTLHATTAEPYLENKKLSEYNDQSDGLHNSPAYQALQKRLDVLFEESKDIFDLLPYKYLPDYKSFCWYDSQDVFQCLASVYLAGMPKCGTTDLFQKLMWHPELTTQSHHTDGGSEKETVYWTRKRVGRPGSFMANPRVPPPKQPFSEFLHGTGAERVKSYKDRRIVDGTPSLLWDLGGWETRYPGLDEPPYSNADLIHAVTPDAKILAILRNPTDRLYSEYLYFWKGSKMRNEVRSPQTFHMDVRRETRKFNRCLESNSLRNCCYSSGYSLRLRVALGVYICYIRDFLEVFGDNFLVVTMEEYHLYPTETLNNIFYHIGVSEPKLEDLHSFLESSKTYNVNSNVKEEVGDMLPETKDLLDTFYAPYNFALAELLADSRLLFRN
ncbi:carbohydrate sulfotransferase 15-like [Bolinopsis microptera]|uniref:carbohydrate sulfotransferase 15-like n=1 Tax=Bolinopsis microptera TaxID=2820187 RepID=UPI003079934A